MLLGGAAVDGVPLGWLYGSERGMSWHVNRKGRVPDTQMEAKRRRATARLRHKMEVPDCRISGKPRLPATRALHFYLAVQLTAARHGPADNFSLVPS